MVLDKDESGGKQILMFTYCILVVSSKLNFVIQKIVLRYYPFHQKRVFVFVSRCKSVEDTEMLVRLHIITKKEESLVTL